MPLSTEIPLGANGKGMGAITIGHKKSCYAWRDSFANPLYECECLVFLFLEAPTAQHTVIGFGIIAPQYKNETVKYHSQFLL